jgi:hypothetical protein
MYYLQLGVTLYRSYDRICDLYNHNTTELQKIEKANPNLEIK